MDIDYDAVWSELSEDLRERLLENTSATLTADDVTALVHAGQPVAMAYWVSQGPQPGDRWYISPGLREYIETLRA